MKLTFELVYGPNIHIFNQVVNQRLAEGWKFMNQPVMITETEEMNGPGHQYSIAMLLEEEE